LAPVRVEPVKLTTLPVPTLAFGNAATAVKATSSPGKTPFNVKVTLLIEALVVLSYTLFRAVNPPLTVSSFVEILAVVVGAPVKLRL